LSVCQSSVLGLQTIGVILSAAKDLKLRFWRMRSFAVSAALDDTNIGVVTPWKIETALATGNR